MGGLAAKMLAPEPALPPMPAVIPVPPDPSRPAAALFTPPIPASAKLPSVNDPEPPAPASDVAAPAPLSDPARDAPLSDEPADEVEPPLPALFSNPVVELSSAEQLVTIMLSKTNIFEL